jgi:superfamily II DNA/RNA helicase
MPPGRTPVRTTLRPTKKRDGVHDFVREQVKHGHQAYIVYPLVDESEKLDLLSATQEYERLRTEVFADLEVGLLHGRLPAAEKDSVMRAFADGHTDILVATTVIEVGVDVPNATVMVIEHAERFGLSQLHQLRGRVGRGSAESHCILIADAGEDAGERLGIFVKTTDGFEIARADGRRRTSARTLQPSTCDVRRGLAARGRSERAMIGAALSLLPRAAGVAAGSSPGPTICTFSTDPEGSGRFTAPKTSARWSRSDTWVTTSEARSRYRDGSRRPADTERFRSPSFETGPGSCSVWP